ncbi:MAG: hypothetical protein OHM77_10170 [Candidatus Nitricoxidivorans perseverans]|uniref:Uncharacterized protein n=1 Tax=Candidatus Nitricoxidivorans perseverans TaxID=2975601 RepID=A0AA49FK43_9PROT|nr:MAG: hypothetical protein OHM77_10170 [Candidatus Nitricoxidivorans perseverans]
MLRRFIASLLMVTAVTASAETMSSGQNNCLVKAMSFRYSMFIEDACKVKGNISKRIMSDYQDSCLDVIPKEEFINIAAFVENQNVESLKTKGKKLYCSDALKEYLKM